MGVELLDPRCEEDVNAVAGLHERFLADSPVVAFGPRFVRSFYYRRLVADELMGCLVCRVDGRVAGFISFTKRPHDFMIVGMRRHLAALAGIMATSVLARPSTLKQIWNTLRTMRERAGQSADDSSGGAEVLSMATLPEYRKQILPGTGSRIPFLLYERVIEHLRGEGFRRVVFLVQPSNVASNLFFNAVGCQFEKVMVAGAPVHRYTYHADGVR